MTRGISTWEWEQWVWIKYISEFSTKKQDKQGIPQTKKQAIFPLAPSSYAPRNHQVLMLAMAEHSGLVQNRAYFQNGLNTGQSIENGTNGTL